MSSMDHRRGRHKRRNFGESWWGNAWVESVEGLAELDQSRLARGRTYARWGYVGALKVKPGVVRARVAGSKATPYHTYVKVNVFTDEEWDALLDVVVEKMAHAAALMDGELTSELVDDAAAVGVNLLPQSGDIEPGCSCPDAAVPCKHAAAVCYLFADLLDDDPFTLLHIRGRTQEEVAEGLRARRRKSSGVAEVEKPKDEVDGVEWFTGREIAPLPTIPRAPAHPGKPPSLVEEDTEGLEDDGEGLEDDGDKEFDTFDLQTLAESVAQRAWEMCQGIGDSGITDRLQIDLIRRMAPYLGTERFDEICERGRIIKSSLEQDATLWQAGGMTALTEADSSWDPEPEVIEPGVEYLKKAGRVMVRGNRVTCRPAGRQLRLGESGRWYEFRLQGNNWRFVDLVEI